MACGGPANTLIAIPRPQPMPPKSRNPPRSAIGSMMRPNQKKR